MEGVTTYAGRGIWYFDGRVACPLAGIGTRGAHAANRLVIEDDRATVTIDRTRARIDVASRGPYREKALVADLTFLGDGVTSKGERSPLAIHLEIYREGDRATVTIDRARARIDVASRGPYPEKALVADLTFLGDGVTSKGERSPLAIHLEIYREGDRITLDLHRHLRTRDPLVDADFEAFTVMVDERGAPRTVLDRAIALELIRHPSLTHRAIKALMAMKDHLEGARQDLGKPGFAIADLELGFGIGPLSKMIVRARLVSLQPASELSGARTAAELFQRGKWELELIALSEKHIADVIKRDLMLFGIDEVPLLAPVRAHGLRRGQRLAFRFERGVGEIVLDDRSAPLDGAPDVARAYLEFHMLGGFLAEYAERFARSR